MLRAGLDSGLAATVAKCDLTTRTYCGVSTQKGSLDRPSTGETRTDQVGDMRYYHLRGWDIVACGAEGSVGGMHRQR